MDVKQLLLGGALVAGGFLLSQSTRLPEGRYEYVPLNESFILRVDHIDSTREVCYRYPGEDEQTPVVLRCPSDLPAS